VETFNERKGCIFKKGVFHGVKERGSIFGRTCGWVMLLYHIKILLYIT
jgi:hypothetical protein